MPRYKVLEKGAMHSQMYYPAGQGKRNVVVTDKPLKPVPMWLEQIKDETASASKKRLAAEKKQAVEDAEKAEQDQNEINEATSFLGDEEPTQAGAKSSVETL